NDPSGLIFSMSNAFKDLGYYRAMADDCEAAHRIADGVLQTYEAATAAAGPQALVPELVSVLAGGSSSAAERL
ncbi:MAG: NAD(P)-dependent oxidoreductase, partial [Burkholderiaceae bacterium]